MKTSHKTHSAEELVYLFGSFLPSQRAILLAESRTNQAQFMSALQTFLGKWARADWLEEYNVERVGEWIAKHCSADVQAAIKATATKMAKIAPQGIHGRTYQALLDGMKRVKQFA